MIATEMKCLEVRGDSLPSAIALILLLHMGLRDCRLGTSQFTHLRAILLEVNSRPGIHISGLELTSRLPSIELTSRSFKAMYPRLRSDLLLVPRLATTLLVSVTIMKDPLPL